MYFSDYIKDVNKDAQQYFYDNLKEYQEQYPPEEHTFEEVLGYLRDDLWNVDEVTGNASGSYTMNSEKAKDNIKDVIFDDEFINELPSIGESIEDIISKGPETIDVVARIAAISYLDEEMLRDVWEGQ